MKHYLRYLLPASIALGLAGLSVAQGTSGDRKGDAILQQYPSNPMPVAVLQGLDKITARIYTFEAPVGQTIGFGTLKVTVQTCRKRPPEYPPESAAYLDIVEQRPGEAEVDRFHGWMFASSPALNPLEHPVYDVWVIDCNASAGGTSAPKQ